jgi:uncharacterized protein (DUF952 family)
VTSRWLYHALPKGEWGRVASVVCDYAPASLVAEGFVHTSYRDAVAESARLYVAPPQVVLRIDPRELAARIEVAATPRGPMPHVHGPIARHAIVEATDLEAWDASAAPDLIE